MIWTVEVDVATHRPLSPDKQRTMFVEVAAESATEAELIACQMADCKISPFYPVVMPVASRITDWPEDV